MTTNPFHISTLARFSDRPLVPGVLQPCLSWLLGLRTYRRLYDEARTGDEPFEARALAALGIDVHVMGERLAAVPSDGPLVVVANHPHGVLDGLALASIVRKVRPDVRILANLWLAAVPELADICFFVDPFNRPDAVQRSRAGLRAARAWLTSGGSLIVFPAGEVAHTARPGPTCADSPWHSTAARLALAARASVLPAFITGRNSRAFYAAGRVHPLLRTLLLARELLWKQNQAVSVSLGAPLMPHRLSASVDCQVTTTVLRAAVEALDVADTSRAGVDTRNAVPSLPGVEVASEMGRLPATACLVDSDSYQVLCAEARQIPHALREIGRLREMAYRAVGEGTGRALDLDRFDDSYLHLVLWDRSRQRIAGAYRIGRADQIVARHGVHGLYARTLFNFDDRFVHRLGPALELGRAFVAPEYQKSYHALLLLWKGIAQVIMRHPQYRVLYGCVSISRAYSDRSRQLMMRFLREHHSHPALPAWIDPVRPFFVEPQPVPSSVDAVNRLVAEQEPDGKGMPVLLRHYLKLHAKLVSANVDADFGEAVDALMVVDLDELEPATLQRFFGRAEPPALRQRSA